MVVRERFESIPRFLKGGIKCEYQGAVYCGQKTFLIHNWVSKSRFRVRSRKTGERRRGRTPHLLLPSPCT